MNSKVENNRFDSSIADDWKIHAELSPEALDMSSAVPRLLKEGCPRIDDGKIVEIGCGTGDTTECILEKFPHSQVIAFDNEPRMLEQAKSRLKTERLSFLLGDALESLKDINSNSIDAIVSVYTFHNFHKDYRAQVLFEVRRVLKEGGLFINGDRCAESDPEKHLATIQSELRHYIRTLLKHDRPDLLEEWICHYIQDQSPQICMREDEYIQSLKEIGFKRISTQNRKGINLIIVAKK